MVTNQIVIDIDECELYDFCDQGCVNLDGSYKCICKKGYYWSGDFGIGCFGNLIIIFVVFNIPLLQMLMSVVMTMATVHTHVST